MRASRASLTEQQDFFADSSAPTWTPLRMKSPITSAPPSRASRAATELSTPPLIAATTRGLASVELASVELAGVELELTKHSDSARRSSAAPSAALRWTRRTSALDRLALPIAVRF